MTLSVRLTRWGQLDISPWMLLLPSQQGDVMRNVSRNSRLAVYGSFMAICCTGCWFIFVVIGKAE
jgi:hypothetical protein